jgi:hypothetical protein
LRPHYATGGEVTAAAVSQIQHADVGDDPEPEADEAASASPEADPKYNPPPAAVANDGQVDNVPIQADEGEMVIQRAAAEQYPPEVLALLNNPEEAADVVAALMEAFPELSGEGDESEPYQGQQDDDYYEAEAASGTSDDNSGYGVTMPPPGQRVPAADPKVRWAGAGR